MRMVAAGALCCALAVVAGAFGAHAFEGRLSIRELELWETAARYLFFGGLGVALVGLSSRAVGRALTGPGACLFVGCLVFSGTVSTLALGGPRWLGAVTPIGGLLMVVGFLWLALESWRG